MNDLVVFSLGFEALVAFCFDLNSCFPRALINEQQQAGKFCWLARVIVIILFTGYWHNHPLDDCRAASNRRYCYWLVLEFQQLMTMIGGFYE